MHITKVYRVFVCTLILVVLGQGFIQAQTSTAKVTGTVTDPSGAVVPSVKVAIVNVATQFRDETTTNDSGIYTISFLNPGSYELRGEAEGFRRYVRENIVLETGQVATFDIALELGAVTDVVSVTAETPLLHTETPTLGQLIENKNIIEMPLVTRRAGKLVTLMGNVAWAGFKGDTVPQFSMAGGGPLNQMWYLDGAVSQNNVMGRPQLIMDPPVEALREMKVLSNIYSAEYGRTRGGHITMVTKSGTNEFHGSLYEFLRNDKLDARPFFARRKLHRRDNVFGGTFGGPVKRDRTFFFVNYEGSFRRTAQTRILDVPDPQEIQGDFSAQSGQVIDPASGDPFPNNMIPQSRFDPVGRQLAGFYPAPNVSGRPSGASNFIGNTITSNEGRAVVARTDHRFGNNDSLYVRYVLNDLPSLRLSDLYPEHGADPFVRDVENRENFITAGWVHNFSPAVINDFRYSFSRRTYKSIPSGTGSGITGQIGLTGVPDDGMPQVTVTGLDALGTGGHFRASDLRTNPQVIEAISWFRGSHSMKFGFEWRRSGFADQYETLRYGSFRFDDRATGLKGTGLPALLLGWVRSANTIADDPVLARSDYYGAYVQDDWKITPRLTFNLGLRWSMDTPRWDEENRQNQFDLTAINPVSGTPGVVTFAGIDGQDKYAHSFDQNSFGPRFGFAWRPLGERTVIRGGYGIMYSGPYGIEGVSRVTTGGFSDRRDFTSPDGGFTPPFLLREGLPGGSQREPLGPGFGAVPVGERARFAPQFFFEEHSLPYGQMFSLSIERQLRANILFEVTYQGNLGHKLVAPRTSINEIRPELRRGLKKADQKLRPFPQFGNVTSVASTWGNSNYHAVNFKLEKRFSHGLNFLANYTWSKFIDDNPNRFDLSQKAGATIPYQSYYNRHAERGVSGNDLAHRFVWSSVYELPVGTGRSFEFKNSALNQILGGWGVGLITEFRTGPAFGVRMQTNRLNAFSSSQRPNVVGDPELSSGRSRGEFVRRWFDTDAFASPGNGIEGNAGRGILRGPGLANFDLSLLKEVSITEGSRVQFRAEFFNLFNRPNFGLPENRVGNRNFARIRRTVTDGRIIQFGLKLIF